MRTSTANRTSRIRNCSAWESFERRWKAGFRKRSKRRATRPVVALLGIASLYGFLSVSELIRAVESSIRGRLLVFFPGTKNDNNYRLLDARDGWNYLAQPITLHEAWVP